MSDSKGPPVACACTECRHVAFNVFCLCSTAIILHLKVSLLEKQCLLASYQRELALHTKAMDTLMLATSTAASTGLLEDPQRRCGLVRQWAGLRMAALDSGVKEVEER